VRIQGYDAGNWTQRTKNSGLRNLKITNASGVAACQGIRIMNCTGLFFERVYVNGFRGAGGGVYARGLADSDFYEFETDFCGSLTDGDLAVIDFSCHSVGSPYLDAAYNGGFERKANGGEWAVDRVRFWGGRIENSGDRIMDMRQGGSTFYCAKICFINTKVETSNLDGNGSGGNAINGAQFYLSYVQGFEWIGADITLQSLRPAHAVLPRMFHIIGANSFYLQGKVSMGSNGGPKVFTTLFDIDGGGGFTFIVRFSNGDGTGAVLPTWMFKYTNSPARLNRDLCTWGFDASATYTTATTGTAPSSSSFNDTLAYAAAANFVHYTDINAHVPVIQNLATNGTALQGLVLCDTSAGGLTVALPTAVGIPGQRRIIVHKVAGNNVVLEGDGTETINGALNWTSVNTAGDSITVISDGANWWKTAQVGAWI